ncbi:MAG: hypothetical protein JRJ59_07375 [Deltaproteobacteria bacterium]|nr:hypothetical protein [Deltaproteobacteria bacterium]
MTVWEWIGTSVLGLQAAILVWLIKDYIKFRLTVVPNLVTEQRCLRCQAGTNQVLNEIKSEMRRNLKEIKSHLERGQGQFKSIAVTLARLGAKLGLNGPT